VETIVLASSSPVFLERFSRQVPAGLNKTATVTQVDPSAGFLDFLRYEIPDLVVLHAGAEAPSFVPVFEGLESDPWLDSIGIILVVPDVEEVIELYQGFNIAYFLNEHEVDRNLGRVIRILDEKREFLNYDGIIKKITVLSGELSLETDLLLVQYYSSLFSNYLFKDGLVDRGKKFSVKLTLEELLTNAMEHGNAGLSYDEKTQLQEAGQSVQDFVEERLRRPPWKGRKVTVEYAISPLSSRFTITDEGEGFDTTRLPTKDDMAAHLDLSHGRGIFLSMNSADSLAYSAKGNEVSVEFGHNGKAERTVPDGFIQSEPRHLAPGDVVFWENTTGDHIYYIVSGEYEVQVHGKAIATLSPADVFMGEMSFLLGNRRTATVIASTPGKLVEISRHAFTEAVKQYPNYGIFLSKMLARRLRDNNRRFAG
jgi:anti-sigma regulatory factor (Ser/Thr protein kinase)